jgi:hypothetical protein
VTSVDRLEGLEHREGAGVIGPITDAKNELEIGASFERAVQTTKENIRAMTDRGFAYSSALGTWTWTSWRGRRR